MLLFGNTVAELEEQLQQHSSPGTRSTPCEMAGAQMTFTSAALPWWQIMSVFTTIQVSIALSLAGEWSSISLLQQMIVEGRVVSLVQVSEAACLDNHTLNYYGTIWVHQP